MDKHIGRREIRGSSWKLPIALAAAVVAAELLAMDVAYERGRYMRTVKSDPVVHLLDKKCDPGLLDPKEADLLIKGCRDAVRKE